MNQVEALKIKLKLNYKSLSEILSMSCIKCFVSSLECSSDFNDIFATYDKVIDDAFWNSNYYYILHHFRAKIGHLLEIILEPVSISLRNIFLENKYFPFFFYYKV